MDEPPPCDPNVYERGQVVFITHGLRTEDLEIWVTRVAAISGQPVDWYYTAGSAIVRALGDLEKVKAAIRALMPEHDDFFYKNLFGNRATYPPRPSWWND